MDATISHFEIIFQLCLAVGLGGLIGLERERKSWFAGLRTHMLVCVGSALIMIVSQYGFSNVLQKDLIVLDPSRVAAQVVSGIGFLGAGTILFWNNMIRGLTTAASLWAVAAVGLAVGGGLYVAATTTTILVLLVLAGIKPLETRFFKTRNFKEIKFWANKEISLQSIEILLNSLNLRPFFKDLKIEHEKEKELIHLTFEVNLKNDLLPFIDELIKLPGVEKVEINEL